MAQLEARYQPPNPGYAGGQRGDIVLHPVDIQDLSVGFGLILCYSSYLHQNDDVVLTSLSASSTNEFCEVILGGMIVVPTAFLFLGADAATKGTFGLGFVTVPAIMHFMPFGQFFGAMWFGLLFLAAVTSSLSMLQPAIAFLEDGFGLKRRASVSILGVITAIGAAMTIYFSKGLLALDHIDFWCNLCMIIAATGLVLMFGWVVGAQRGVKEMNRGADFSVPPFMAFTIRYITPTFLIVILAAWTYTKLPGYLDGMNPAKQGPIAAEAKVQEALGLCDALTAAFTDDALSDEQLAEQIYETVDAVTQPGERDALAAWTREMRAEEAMRTFADDTERGEFYCRAVAQRFGMPPAVEDQAAIVAGFLAEAALTPGELANKIHRLAGEHAEDLDVARTAGFVEAVREKAEQERQSAIVDANVARFVLLGIILFFVGLVVLSDVACRNAIGRTIAQAERSGVGWETAS